MQPPPTRSGGQDEVVFEGHSFALQADGALAARAPSFAENLFAIEVINNRVTCK